MAKRKYKYRPYRTRKQEQSRRMRNIALTLIIIIVGGVVLTKMYNRDNTEPATPDNSDRRSLTEALEGSDPQESEEMAPTETTEVAESEPTPSEPVEEEPVNVVDEQTEPEPVVQEDTTSEEARQLIEEAIELRKQGKVIAARGMLNHALDLQLSPQIRSGVKAQLANLAKIWLFSKEILADDKLTGQYRVAPGDMLSIIAKRHKVPYEILMEINGIHRPELLQAGQKLKIVHGPFNAVVYKSNFTMDLYLQDKYVKTYRVGLGAKETETPSGHWRVKANGRFDTKPSWTDQRTGKTYEGSHPDYPLGERYIAIEGLDENTKNETGFAIHGTKDPESIGRRESLGCIRMYNEDVIEVYDMLRSGVSEVWIMD